MCMKPSQVNINANVNTASAKHSKWAVHCSKREKNGKRARETMPERCDNVMATPMALVLQRAYNSSKYGRERA